MKVKIPFKVLVKMMWSGSTQMISLPFIKNEFVIGTTVFRDLPRMNTTTYGGGEEFNNEDYYSMDDVGVLSSILDIVDPSWRSSGGMA